MLTDISAVHPRVHKLIWVRELAASHKPEQMLLVRVREKLQPEREDCFDGNEIIAERHQRTLRHLYAGDDLEPFQIVVH